jgi:hypothetical protein
VGFFRSSLAIVVACTSSLLIPGAPGANAEEPAELLREVQGTWTRCQTTATGPIRIVKEHKGNKTVVTAYDDKDKVIYAHESEFKVEQTGKVRIFTFHDRVITAGPNAGAKIPAPQSFVYRVSDGRFVEAHGVLEGESTAPSMIVWERMP